MERKNYWFLVSGILSIVSCAVYFIIIIVGIVGVSNAENFVEGMTQQDLQAMKSGMLVLIALGICALAIGIFCSVTFMRYSSYSFDKVKERSGAILTAIVLCFLAINILSAIFALIGYCSQPNENLSNYNRLKNEQDFSIEDMQEKLEKLNRMKEKGLIGEEEFKKIRAKIIEDSFK